MLLLFILTFLFWIVAALDIRINGQHDLERKYWYKYDPTLIAEGIFCLATIMAFLKLLFICQLDYDLGPLQLSLIKMIKDVGHFIAIFGIILLAFTAGKINVANIYILNNNLYIEYYENNQLKDLTQVYAPYINIIMAWCRLTTRRN